MSKQLETTGTNIDCNGKYKKKNHPENAKSQLFAENKRTHTNTHTMLKWREQRLPQFMTEMR